MKQYQKKFQRWWMDTDHKPKGRLKSLLERTNRQEWRKEATEIKRTGKNSGKKSDQ